MMQHAAQVWLMIITDGCGMDIALQSDGVSFCSDHDSR
jgi:hypothetical protein